jgi:hypothetical protein
MIGALLGFLATLSIGLSGLLAYLLFIDPLSKRPSGHHPPVH